MELNRNGKFAKFYMWLPPEDKQLPKDFCTFFWGLVGRAFLIFGMGGMVLVLLCFGIYLGALWVWAHKIPVLFALGFIAVLILTIWYDERKEKRPTKAKPKFMAETRTILRTEIDSVKNKYCPRIDWK